MELIRAKELIKNSNEINMNILLVQKVRLTEKWRAENITSSFTRIYMVTSGSGYLRYADKEIIMKPGGVYVIPAGIALSYGCIDHLEKIYVHLSIPLFNNLDLFNGTDKIFEFYEKEKIDMVGECFDGDTALKVIKFRAYLFDLVGRCFEQNKDTKIQNYSDYVFDIINYVEKNLSAKLTVETIAEALFTSTAKIRKKFMAEMGTAIGKYIDERLMLRAELEVRGTDFSIKVISEKLGFCDQFYFSKRFSAKYGMPPLKYRKEQVYKK